MKKIMLACAAGAALGFFAAPALGATPEIAQPAFGNQSADPGVAGFYAARHGAPLWLRNGPDSPAARTLIQVLMRSPLDGFASGPALAIQAQSLMARASTGDASALGQADLLLSKAWVEYVQSLKRPPAGMIYASDWLAPRIPGAGEILQLAAAAPSLEGHVQRVSSVSPIYSQIRDAAQQQLGNSPDPRVVATLERVRALPAKGRYVVVDAAGAQLWMVEDGNIQDRMKVIVGKPTSQTPMLASTIYYATVNPYWNVPPDLVQKLIAPRVLGQGIAYLKAHSYQVLDGPGEDARVISPDKVDWKAVAAGTATQRVRQLPGPGNSMGRLKFGFANGIGIFLHDSPEKQLFDADNRSLSNGCIRLEDAQRLGRWLMGRDVQAASSDPEQHIALPKPVPVYVTYLTARADGGQLSFVDDVYGKDVGRATEVAALR